MAFKTVYISCVCYEIKQDQKYRSQCGIFTLQTINTLEQ